ncbi:MAG: hypothetical protein ABI651_02325 [Verrucomicrobiota bacterium]
MRLVISLLITSLTLAGCATKGSKSTNETKKKATPLPKARAANQKSNLAPTLQLTGKVASVNSELRFVVLEFSVGDMPGINQRLGVYRASQKVGQVKVTGPQSDTNIVADIVEGEAHVGDEVRQE